MYMNPTTEIIDAYKLGHPFMQPPGVSFVYTGWTGRSFKYMADMPYTVIWGHQARIKQWFVDFWNEKFFKAPIDELEKDAVRKIESCFSPRYSDWSRFRKLHKLGYLPIEIWGLPEGTLCPARTPDHVMWNTHPDFAWLPQYLEDMWSTNNWHPSTSATTAYDRRKIMQGYVDQTCDDTAITKYLISDFSLRGMTSIEAAHISSGGHLLSFAKTATIGAAGFLEEYYGADPEKDLPNAGTPSLEHSVVCQGVAYYEGLLLGGGGYKGITWDKYKNDGVDIKLAAEMCFIKYLITELQPEGALSYVADTCDYWGVLTWILPKLKDDILNRKGVLIIRPDSGDPVQIVCGDQGSSVWYENLGSVRVLDKIFGSSVNKKGYKVLPAQIRLIYADAINRQRNADIPKYIAGMGYSAENVYFGIGSVSYQFVTRDTRGYAVKATGCVLNGVETQLYKKPKTDDGVKTSQKGCFAVHYGENGEITYTDELTFEQAVNFKGNLLVVKFKNGEQFNTEDFATIRKRLYGDKF